MKLARIFADSAGESHFDETEVPLPVVDFTPPAPPIGVSVFDAAARIGFVSAPARWNGIPHVAPVKAIFVFMSGQWEVTASDGETRTFEPGGALRVEDTIGKGHTTRLLGDQPGVAALIQLEQ